MFNLCPICNNPKSMSIQKPTTPSLWAKTCGGRNCVKKLRQKTNMEKYGHISNLHGKADNGCTVLQNIIKEKYNVENVSQIHEVKLKKQTTCMENFGVPWPMQSDIVRAKSVETLISKYGYDNISKCPQIIEKIKQSQIERYGDLYVRTDEGKEKIREICREKHGVDWYFSSDDFKQKLEKRCIELYGVTNPFFSAEVQSEIAKRNSRGKSKEETDWLNSLGIDEKYRQYAITAKSGRTYIVDGFDYLTNTVYEWNGSFWHGNPSYYDPSKPHPVIQNTTFGELYEKTIRKQEDILQSGYNLIVKWSKV